MVIMLMVSGMKAFAQEDPPRPLEVSTFQNLSFGAVIQGNVGGQITIDPQGSRIVSGDIIPVNMGYSYFPAIFEVEGVPGEVITIINGPDVSLTGNHGGTLTLHIGNSWPASPFINSHTPPFRTQVRIGGTLYVGNALANPSGDYIGYFNVTFAQQ